MTMILIALAAITAVAVISVNIAYNAIVTKYFQATIATEKFDYPGYILQKYRWYAVLAGTLTTLSVTAFMLGTMW